MYVQTLTEYPYLWINCMTTFKMKVKKHDIFLTCLGSLSKASQKLIFRRNSYSTKWFITGNFSLLVTHLNLFQSMFLKIHPMINKRNYTTNSMRMNWWIDNLIYWYLQEKVFVLFCVYRSHKSSDKRIVSWLYDISYQL